MADSNASNTSGNATKTATPQNAREMVSSLIASIPSVPSEVSKQDLNPLRALSEEAKNIFLTLYALFGKELLPALDLLDRGLVSRLVVKRSQGLPANDDQSTARLGREAVKLPVTYLVRSAQQHNSRNAAYEHFSHYEVRLQAWSCSCPAFTFSAFPAVVPTRSEVGEELACATTSREHSFFGGLTRGDDTPVCKHMLACVLVEHCSMFAFFVKERETSMEEMAGWAAGWGD